MSCHLKVVFFNMIIHAIVKSWKNKMSHNNFYDNRLAYLDILAERAS